MTETKPTYEEIDSSRSIANVAAALVAAQVEFKPAPFNATNPFLKNKYADLGSVIETARPVLAKHGLSILQPVVSSGMSNIGIQTILLHKSGEYIASTVILPIVDQKGLSVAQSAGVIITYLRRYALASMLGIYADEDTDANEKNKESEKKKTTKKSKKSDRPMTPAKLKKGLNIRAEEIGKQDFEPLHQSVIGATIGNLELCFSGDDASTEKRRSVTSYVFGEESFKELTSPQILALKRWLNATEDSGNAWTPDPMAVKEAHAVVKAHMKEKGQGELI